MDEKSFKRGHSYITLLTDLEESRVLEVVEERTLEAADQLWATLTPEQKSAVEAVAVDMWEPFIQTIQRQVPEADIVHDRFHVSKYLNESVDKVRRQEHKELLAEGDETLKGTRQLWLYNPQHFSPEQRAEFSGLKDQQLKVARAWAMKERFSKFWEYQEAGICSRTVWMNGSHISTATASTVAFCPGLKLSHNFPAASLVRSSTTSSTRDCSKSVNSVTEEWPRLKLFSSSPRCLS